MTENEKIELFDKWYDENYDEWAEGEEGIALREELEQAFKSGIATIEKENAELKKQNKILSKALNLYINWADECGIAWDNFPDEKEKWLKTVEEKGLGWIEGLTFMVMSEAENFLKESEVEK